jgi:hypothetical protein
MSRCGSSAMPISTRSRPRFARVDAPSVEARLGPRVERLGRTVAMVPCAGLDDVAAAVRHATTSIEHPLEARDFSRPLDDRADEELATVVPRSGFALSATFTVTEVHLVRSHLSREGSRYVDSSRRAALLPR